MSSRGSVPSRVNVTGAMHTVRACLADLLRSDAGRIVNVASTESLAAGRLRGPYTVSKHALLGFTRLLAVELGRTGVTAKCVRPGATLTGMAEVIPEADRDTFARRAIPFFATVVRRRWRTCSSHRPTPRLPSSMAR
jgi:3-oxoacyl-[acyl-carrier protein] reductase